VKVVKPSLLTYLQSSELSMMLKNINQYHFYYQSIIEMKDTTWRVRDDNSNCKRVLLFDQSEVSMMTHFCTNAVQNADASDMHVII